MLIQHTASLYKNKVIRIISLGKINRLTKSNAWLTINKENAIDRGGL